MWKDTGQVLDRAFTTIERTHMIRDEFGLTHRQRAFADDYLADPERNATRAYRTHYKSKGKAAEFNASRLISTEKVANYVAAVERRRLAKVQEQFDINDAWLVERWRRIIEFDVRKLFDADGRLKPVSELDDDTAFVISAIDVSLTKLRGADQDQIVEEVTRKFRALDKSKALEALGQHIGFYGRHQAQQRPLVVLAGFIRPSADG
jgi:phage terminase small subunit